MIERSLLAVRRDQSRRRPPPGDGPFAEWGGHPGSTGEPGSPGADGQRGPHGRFGPHGQPGPFAGHPHAWAHGPWGGQPGDLQAFGDSARSGPSRRGRDGSLGRTARYRMLEALAEAAAAGRDLSISSLAGTIGVDQPRASRLVQEGVERGLVRRVPDPSDARRALIQLTAAGRARLGEVQTHRRSVVEAALADFTPEEARTFAALFDRFVRAWPRP